MTIGKTTFESGSPERGQGFDAWLDGFREECAPVLEFLRETSDAVIGLNPHNRVVFLNRSALQLFGYAEEQLLEKDLSHLCAGERNNRPANGPVGKGPLPQHFRASFKRKCGGVFLGEAAVCILPIPGSVDEVRFWFIRDISNQVRVEEILRDSNRDLEMANRELDQSRNEYRQKADELAKVCGADEGSPPAPGLVEAKFRKLLHTAVDAVLTINGDSKIQFYNEAAERLFGYSPDEITGKPVTKIIPCMHCEVCNKDKTGCFENWIRHTLGKTAKTSALTNDGGELDIEISLSDMTLDNERTLIAIIRDITEPEVLKRKLEEKTRQLETANMELEEANQLKSEFLANASHELRTPLNSIIGFLGLIQEGLCESEAEKTEFIENALQSSNHLLTLINDILDISKIEAGKMTLDLEKVDPAKIFNDLYILTHVQAQQKGLQLDFLLPQEDTICVRADYNHLKQIFLNLIGNSIKFTEKGTVTVSAEPQPEKGYVQFIVRDSGIGVSEQKLKKLFNKFVQGDGSMTRKYGGTGLGLTITKSLVELMGGIIKMESEGDDKGTTVTFTVPIYTSDDVLFDKKHAGKTVDQVAPSNEPIILIVEDDPIIRSLIEDILQQEGLKTVCAATADDAVAIARKCKPQVMTLDFGLLAREHAVLKTGWDIISVLSKDKATKDIRFIIISGYDEPIREKIQDANLDFEPEFLGKPFDANVLMEKVNNLLAAGKV